VSAAELFVDTLATGGSYLGDAAVAYDAFMPPGTVFDDDRIHLETLRRAGGTGLELGVGTGRFLLAARHAGLALEGVDRSPSMLERCRRHLVEAGLDATVHEGDIAPLALDRTYDAIVGTASTFTLVDDPLVAADALRSYLAHLRPGGALSLTMFTGAAGTSNFVWRLRRTGTDAETGLTYVVHEATGADVAPQTLLVYNRLEVVDPDGALVRTSLQKLRLRWWHREELTDVLRTVGFDGVRVFGQGDGWVVVAHRP
jgi:SAM-dependent methyltransferase